MSFIHNKEAKVVPIETEDFFQGDQDRSAVIRKALTMMNENHAVTSP